MSAAIYTLCMLTSMACAGLLLFAWRRSRYRLLLWSGLCFAGLTLNNLALVIDKVVVPDIDLSIWRASLALLAMVVLLYGLIWESE
jgi:hypothetical protein